MYCSRIFIERKTGQPESLYFRFTNQTMTLKCSSTILFFGSLTSIEGDLYLELHNFSFVRAQQNFPSNSAKPMPQSKSLIQTSDNLIPTSETIAQQIHNNKKSIISTLQINKLKNHKILNKLRISQWISQLRIYQFQLQQFQKLHKLKQYELHELQHKLHGHLAKIYLPLL